MMAIVSYLSPKGRQMQRDVLGSVAEIMVAARRIARKPGYRNVKVWSQGGRLLASPGSA
jgi:hypothetical protein